MEAESPAVDVPLEVDVSPVAWSSADEADLAGADDDGALAAVAMAGVGAAVAGVEAEEASPVEEASLVEEASPVEEAAADLPAPEPAAVELDAAGWSGSEAASMSAPTSVDAVPQNLVAPDGEASAPAPAQPTPSFSASRSVRIDPPTKPQSSYGEIPYEATAYGDSNAQWGSNGQWGSSAQYGSNAQYAGANPQYAGPSQPYSDLAEQYPAAAGDRRPGRGRGRLIGLIVAAVVAAAAAGGGAALALRHNDGPGSTANTVPPSPTTPFGSVNALNNPSTTSPSGWTTETVQPSAARTAGFSIGIPPGWSEKHSAQAYDFLGPSGTLFEVDLTPHTYQNMVTEARFIKQEQLRGGTFPGYKQAHLQEVPVRGTQGAFWQFSWMPPTGVEELTDDILFILPTSAGSQSYAVYFRGPASGWNSTYLPTFERILRTFRTIPS